MKKILKYIMSVIQRLTVVFDKVYNSDVAIIGTGIAGLSTLYFISSFLHSDKEVSFTLISKSPIGYGTSTYYSAAAFRCPVGGYTVNEHLKDTLDAGRYLNRNDLVKILVQDAVESVLSLEKIGIKFKVSKGTLRVITANDELYPGKELVSKFKDYVKTLRNIRILESCNVVDIVRADGGYHIVCILNDGRRVLVNASITVMATGGASNIYSRSDNPQQLSCDGHAMALRLGLPLINMEFIQFFPLGIAEPARYSFMIPFTKGKLVNRLNEDVISKYGLGSLSKAIIYYRDALSIAIINEVNHGLGVDDTLLLYPELDLGNELNRFASLLMVRLGLRSPIKVLPTAHFSMGGVEVDTYSKTVFEGLYAVGEIAGGIHGANRLGGNALTACAVFARRAAYDITRKLMSRDVVIPSHITSEPIHDVLCKLKYRQGSYNPSKLLDEVRMMMWSRAGVIKSKEGLNHCINHLERIYEKLKSVSIQSLTDLITYLKLENTLLVAQVVALTSLLRNESRGSHFREDYPVEDPHWLKMIRVIHKDGRVVNEIVALS